jgi:predicted nucleic acid-binding protein
MSFFEGLIADIKSANCEIVIFPFVQFEFTRGAFELEHKRKRSEFIEALQAENLPVRTDDLIRDAIEIANLYASKKVDSPSMIDCSIAALMKIYSDKLFLCTLNHKDFPLFLFNRFHIYTMDADRNIYPFGFYEFNKDKFDTSKI